MNFQRTIDPEIHFPPTPGRCRYCGRAAEAEYCSPDCRHAVAIRTDWPYARQFVAHRAGYYCEECHADLREPYRQWLAARPAGLDSTPEARAQWRARFPDVGAVHHVRPIAQGGGACDEENLMFLCHDCHTRAHRLLRTPDDPRQGMLL